ncbi:MAG: CRTAC1 family protein [Acidobacteria bacterium]|nr:CRTAC1 family protein [Acidobacteriota bacterium]NIQ30650.1 CRTAC1 family protein [Acidobacteriota bacterium]NIQ85608.1 CRTAC1 family protein [Acidobacteriota bacterium]
MTRSGHQKMLDILQRIAERARDDHPYLGARMAGQSPDQLAEQATDDTLDPADKWVLHLQAGQADLYLGNLQSGIDHLLKAYETVPETPGARTRLNFELGVAYMRLGETQNCCARETPEACILPIRGEGRHSRQKGSKQAIKYFEKVMRARPRSQTEVIEVHLAAQWLLNIAYMTLGKYPDEVPQEFLIPPESFESEIDFPRFKNVHPHLGLNTFNLAGGAIVDDFDGDDFLDIVASTWDTAGQIRFFRNDGDGTFSDRTEQSGLLGLFGGLNMVHADYDNDGDPDVLVLRGAWLGEQGQHPNSLLRNDGDGTFTDVTFDAGLGRVHYPTKTAAWGDYDNDGDLDLYVGNETTPEMTAPAQLFRNNGDGTFKDVAGAAGLEEALFAMGAVWGDFNDDRHADLFVSAVGDNRLYRNNGDGTFSNVAPEMAVTEPQNSFPAWFWDFDNDGTLDIFVGASSGPVGVLALNPFGVGTYSPNAYMRSLQKAWNPEMMALYRGKGTGAFENVARERNLRYPAQPMGANFGDLNNDGFPDFYLATGNVRYSELRPNVMFLNRNGNDFVNVTMSGGFGHLQKGHGVSFADLDNDGDLDVYVQMGGAFPGDKFSNALFENPGFGNHWITVELVGRRSNRSAIGARVHVEVEENGARRSIYRHINSGGSFGANPLRQTIGLGKATKVRLLEVFWPTTGRTQVFRDVAADQAIQIVEGQDRYTELRVRRITLGR